MHRPATTILLAVILACAIGVPALAQNSGAAVRYSVQQRWDLGPASRWDYVDIDPQRHRLFLTRADRVQVIDLATGKPVGEIAGTAGVHGVAFAQELNLGFTSNGKSNSVTVFDLGSLAVKQELKVSGVDPDTILYEPGARKLYTFNGKSNDVSVIDAVTLKALATIKVGGTPEFAVSDHAGRIFMNIESSAEIVVLDVAADKVLARWPIAGCEEPTGLALDRAHDRLFSVCRNKVMAVIDSKNGRKITEVAIGARPDAAAYDADSGTVFSSNGDGTLSVIRQLDADHYSAATLATVKGARTMAFDQASKKVYLPSVANQVFTVLVVAP
ncbi:MAG: YncE family protein [Pseudomonadota bacterium]|nr:YncE family protein [Pseudomonadota bacterium]